METELLERVIMQHGMSGVIAFSFGYFVIKKLPSLIERHLDSLDKHFEGIQRMMSDFDERHDERHKELMLLLTKDKKKWD